MIEYIIYVSDIIPSYIIEVYDDVVSLSTPPPITDLVVSGDLQVVEFGDPIVEIVAECDGVCVFGLEGDSDGLVLEQITPSSCTINGTPTGNMDIVLLAIGTYGGVQSRSIRISFTMSQEQYDLLAPHNANIFYLIHN